MLGYFSKTKKRNEKTGETVFTFITQTDVYVCNGVIPYLPQYIPLDIKLEVTKCCEKFKYANVIEYNISGADVEKTKIFLASSYFDNFGPVRASKFIESFNSDDVFKTINKMTIDKLTETYNLSADFIKVTEKVKNITELVKLHKYISSYGGSCSNAVRFFAEYGLRSFDVIEKNPYTLIYAGVPFKACEAIAGSIHMPGYDKKRVKAAVSYAMNINAGYGNTKISLDDLLRSIKGIDKITGIFETEKIFILSELSSSDYVIEKTDNIYVYKKNDYDEERIVADSIKLIQKNSRTLLEKIDINKIDTYGINLSGKQQDAFNILKTTGIKILTGGPGTGKTTVIKAIIDYFEKVYPYKRIILTAPTGCAAKRMSQVTGRNAVTIHRLLNLRPYDNTVICDKQIDADLVIVDESSMIDTFIMSKLLSAVKKKVLMVFVGDPEQLPSISPGNILSDMILSNLIETYELDVVHRQQEGDLIIRNSQKIRDGDKILSQGGSFCIKRYQDEAEMISNAMEEALKYEKNKEDYKLFSPVKKKVFPSGTIRINHEIKRKINTVHNSNNKCVEYGDYIFNIGDRVIFVKNNYELDYYNGEEGIIKEIQNIQGDNYISIETEQGTVTISNRELGEIELGYAITAHKSQGSECDNAVIIVPQNPSSMLLRKLLYVEVTRAKKHVTIYSERNAVDIAISTYHEFDRKTGLLEKILDL